MALLEWWGMAFGFLAGSVRGGLWCNTYIYIWISRLLHIYIYKLYIKFIYIYNLWSPFSSPFPSQSRFQNNRGSAMVLKRSHSSFLYEEELRDLLTYPCPVTGKKRCPPFQKEIVSGTQSCILTWCMTTFNMLIVVIRTVRLGKTPNIKSWCFPLP